MYDMTCLSLNVYPITPAGYVDLTIKMEIGMKKVMVMSAIVSASLVASQAHAVLYTLESCEYKWIPEYGKSLYVGTYKSSYGNYFTKTFERYCPASINQ